MSLPLRSLDSRLVSLLLGTIDYFRLQSKMVVLSHQTPFQNQCFRTCVASPFNCQPHLVVHQLWWKSIKGFNTFVLEIEANFLVHLKFQIGVGFLAASHANAISWEAIKAYVGRRIKPITNLSLLNNNFVSSWVISNFYSYSTRHMVCRTVWQSARVN